jgi:hypothetical protein
MVDRGKKIVSAFYGRPATYTLMNECGGAGSRDALQLVQDFPDDLDMATAVGFTNWGTHHGVAQMWVYQATHKTRDWSEKCRSFISADACARDSVRRIIEDPNTDFDPASRSSDSAPDCLTGAVRRCARFMPRRCTRARRRTCTARCRREASSGGKR